jgi:hypothetical protein
MQLRGVMALFRPGLSLETLRETQARLERAARLVPYSADARNLEVLSRLVLAYTGRQPGIDLRAALDDLRSAAAAEPGNRVVLENIARLCRLLLSADATQPPGWTPLNDGERTDLRRQAEAIEALGARRQAPRAGPGNAEGRPLLRR